VQSQGVKITLRLRSLPEMCLAPSGVDAIAVSRRRHATLRSAVAMPPPKCLVKILLVQSNLSGAHRTITPTTRHDVIVKLTIRAEPITSFDGARDGVASRHPHQFRRGLGLAPHRLHRHQWRQSRRCLAPPDPAPPSSIIECRKSHLPRSRALGAQRRRTTRRWGQRWHEQWRLIGR
jgi:hypothetical protein